MKSFEQSFPISYWRPLPRSWFLVDKDTMALKEFIVELKMVLKAIVVTGDSVEE